jgi:N-acyl-D-aspartate/D-glutamate deacylase
MGWELSWHPFMLHPTYRSLAALPITERVAALRRPEVRGAILAEQPSREDAKLLRIATAFDRIFALSDPPDYEPAPDQSLAARARQTGRTPQELAYDAMLEPDGTGLLYYPIVNYIGGNLDEVGEMLARTDTVLGLGDAGAHCGTICDASFPTTLLTLWGRDRRRGTRFELEWLVRRQTADGADAVGLSDRGRLLPGLRADINLIDFEHLSARHPVVTHDLPGGGRRLMQRAAGYKATIVAGEVVVTDGQTTGALPGRLVRGAR